jgi:hypothetical protein
MDREPLFLARSSQKTHMQKWQKCCVLTLPSCAPQLTALTAIRCACACNHQNTIDSFSSSHAYETFEQPCLTPSPSLLFCSVPFPPILSIRLTQPSTRVVVNMVVCRNCNQYPPIGAGCRGNDQARKTSWHRSAPLLPFYPKS